MGDSPELLCSRCWLVSEWPWIMMATTLLRRRSGDTCLPRLFALLVPEGLVRVYVSRVRGPGVLIQVAAAS